MESMPRRRGHCSQPVGVGDSLYHMDVGTLGLGLEYLFAPLYSLALLFDGVAIYTYIIFRCLREYAINPDASATALTTGYPPPYLIKSH